MTAFLVELYTVMLCSISYYKKDGKGLKRWCSSPNSFFLLCSDLGPSLPFMPNKIPYRWAVIILQWQSGLCLTIDVLVDYLTLGRYYTGVGWDGRREQRGGARCELLVWAVANLPFCEDFYEYTNNADSCLWLHTPPLLLFKSIESSLIFTSSNWSLSLTSLRTIGLPCQRDLLYHGKDNVILDFHSRKLMKAELISTNLVLYLQSSQAWWGSLECST